jgi:hypothetical protein
LPKQLIIVIGLKLLGSSLSSLFLCNGIIFPDNQSSGIQPLSNIQPSITADEIEKSLKKLKKQ